jgi:hypothetical protein
MSDDSHIPNSGWSRRRWLQHSGLGAGSLAAAALLSDEGRAAANTGSEAGIPHHRPTARNVIFLFMSGGPSQVDTFDPKPELARLNGRDVPESLARNVPRIQRAGLHNVMASPFAFSNHGESGLAVSELLPATARHADELCVIRSMHHRNPVHGPGECVALTGTALGDRPGMGAWVTYGLGSETQSLPAFIVMNLNTDGMQYPQSAGWGAGFLPSRHQGTVVRPAVGIQDVDLPAGIDASQRQQQLRLIEALNRRHLEQLGEHSELEARIRSYEMAFRMQTSAPELFAIDGETQPMQSLYGLDREEMQSMGRACLLARRMVERGVRFVQIRFGGWDAHGNLEGNHRKMASRTDVPIGGLLADLKQRGLLDETLVVWGGEFGRTPTMEGRGKGRDHNPSGYCVWLAGGGVRGGQTIGATDPIGYVPVERPVGIHDFHATLLHAVGLDQYQLAYRHNGREELPTFLGGEVVGEVFG